MSKEIHIDQFIQEKLEFLSVPYEDSFWEGAEKLIINAEKEKRKRFLWWIFLFTIVIASLVIYSVLSSPNNSTFNSNSTDPTVNKGVSGNISDQKQTNSINHTSILNTSVGLENNNNTNGGLSINKKQKEVKLNQTKNKTISLKKNRKRKEAKMNNSVLNEDIILDSIAKEQQQQVKDSLEALKSIAILNNYKLNVPNEFNLWLTEEEQQKKYTKNRAFIGFSAGATINEKFGMGYFISTHAQKIISRKWSTRISAQLAATKFPYLKYNYSTIDYSFGEEVTNTEIKSDLIYSLQIPISLHYRFYKLHSGFIGLGYAKYLAQKNSISSNVNGEIQLSSEYGVSKDLRANNIYVSLGYESLLFKRYQVGVSAQLPLMNPIVNSIKNTGNSASGYTEMRVYILYNLIKIR